MEEIRDNIAFIQQDLNNLLGEDQTEEYGLGKTYLLSVMLDKEIVKYYKNLATVS